MHEKDVHQGGFYHTSNGNIYIRIQDVAHYIGNTLGRQGTISINTPPTILNCDDIVPMSYDEVLRCLNGEKLEDIKASKSIITFYQIAGNQNMFSTCGLKLKGNNVVVKKAMPEEHILTGVTVKAVVENGKAVSI